MQRHKDAKFLFSYYMIKIYTTSKAISIFSKKMPNANRKSHFFFTFAAENKVDRFGLLATTKKNAKKTTFLLAFLLPQSHYN